ncbi:hypothetical protein BH10BAC2_BH10BAC2_04140 [soil metagenome]
MFKGVSLAYFQRLKLNQHEIILTPGSFTIHVWMYFR